LKMKTEMIEKYLEPIVVHHVAHCVARKSRARGLMRTRLSSGRRHTKRLCPAQAGHRFSDSLSLE
jgi:hypothetical protein